MRQDDNVWEDVGFDFWLGRRFGCGSGWGGSGIGDEGCVIREYRYGNWISGTKRSKPLRAYLWKRAKHALACAQWQALCRIWSVAPAHSSISKMENGGCLCRPQPARIVLSRICLDKKFHFWHLIYSKFAA